MTLALLRVAAEVRSHSEREPLAYFRPTPPQLAFLSDPGAIKLLRGGNQTGKTWAQCAEVHWRATGTHPYLRTHDPPIEAWIITHSWEQSLSVQSKFWELAPKELVDPGVEFIPGKGFRGKVPVIRYKNGSIVRIKTTNQGTLGLASATLHYVGIDEPPPRAIWGELAARVLRNRGVIGLTMTPVGIPCGWLKELVEQGKVSEHPAPLTIANVTPKGGRALLSQAEIDEVAGNYLNIDRAQRLEGAWEGMPDEVLFEGFSQDMIDDFRLTPLEGHRQYLVGIGIDHGADAGSQVAVLVAVNPYGDHPSVYVLDEYVAGAAEPDHHARQMVDMLRRNGMGWESVDHWRGDRKYGGKKWGGKMSNIDLMRAFERLLGYPTKHLPFTIRVPRKPGGSVYEGANHLHSAMQRRLFRIRPRCEALIRSIQRWQGRDDDNKHAIDALRYAVQPLLRTMHTPRVVTFR